MIDPCLFLKEQMIFLIYVDYTIITGPDAKTIEEYILSLGMTENDQVHTFELCDEGEVGAFLGIKIERNDNQTFYLTQPSLIQNVLATVGMDNSKYTVKFMAISYVFWSKNLMNMGYIKYQSLTYVGIFNRPGVAGAVL